ncbi:hypothetical protein GWK16_12885 [Roseomonas sp. JC162]|uniref:Capsular polysaccharide biosynthesis protein n=1 Tax=Neoroseomonas marina TaxID=1232220 RepID=A0A848EFC1_9PROT|nr:hypothetical protein [Neoroseomonas marina]NMJ42143.1 hypothetical protein [Neoroseomonas marina]
MLLLPVDAAAPPGWGGGILYLDPGPFAPPALGGQEVPTILFADAAPDPVRSILTRGAPRLAADYRQRLRAAVRAARLGGPAGLPDPGPAALGLGPGEAILVVDPCDPALAGAAAALLDEASVGDTRPCIVRDPFAPARASTTLHGARPERLSPWTLIDAAAAVHAAPGAMARLAALAGCRVIGAGGDADPLDALAAAARCVDPIGRSPIGLEEALETLGTWRRQHAQNRDIAVCVGMSFWKRRRIGAALGSAGAPVSFARGGRDAVATASRRGGAIAVWASRAPRGLVAQAAQARVPLVWIEDGFIRSAGLGAGFLPGASLTCDRRRPYYDPSGPSDLERLLATAEVPSALRKRAEALRAALRAGGVTKYNLPGAAPVLPSTPGRRRILVPGQVEDDLSVRLGASAEVRGNLDLLRAVRAAAPDAFIAFKPHPDVEAGYRRGAVPEAEARALADVVVARAPIAPLLDQVEEVHTITSLTGFEALLRGRAVTCWGRPFYAGWGLTEDRAPIPRRRRRLSVDELLAIALILYPRYLDPVTELPCTPEQLIERLREPRAWSGGFAARLRRWQGRVMARLLPGRG